MRHVFIVNPMAGKHKALEMTHFIVKNFEDPIILTTEYEGHAKELAKEYAGKDTAIYSLGGDGTFNEVVNGVVESDFNLDTLVADVPCGSGNDFIKVMTDEKDPYKLLESYKKGNTKIIDVGFINDRTFVNIASIGFDAEIVLGARKYKRLPLVSAELAYLISVFATLIKLRGYKVKATIDGEAISIYDVLFIIMANGNYYGGGMKAAPHALMDDGLFDFYLVDKVKRRQVPFLLPKFMKGRHDELKVVHHYKGKKIIIDSEKPLPMNIDGEVMLSNHVEVEVKANVLHLLIP